MSLFKRGKIWWYTFVKDGHRYQISTSSTSKDIARRAEARKRTELDEERNNLPAKRKPITFQMAAKQWMEARRADWSQSNYDIQTYNLKHLNSYLGSEMLTAISAERIGKYKAIRKNESASNRTINMEVGTVRMILKHFKLWRAIEEDVKMLRERKDAGRALSPEEEARLLEACGNSPQPSLLTAVVVFQTPAFGIANYVAPAGRRSISRNEYFK